MTPTFYIALRFLFHRKRAFILSLCGVVFGVAIFICTQAQTQGFTKNFIDATLGSSGAIMLRGQFSPRYGNLYVAPKNANVAAARRRYFEGITNAVRDHAHQPAFSQRRRLRAGPARNADGAGRV